MQHQVHTFFPFFHMRAVIIIVHFFRGADSGALCVALTRPAAASACKAFAERTARKEYLALVRGDFNLTCGTKVRLNYHVLFELSCNDYDCALFESGRIIASSGNR